MFVIFSEIVVKKTQLFTNNKIIKGGLVGITDISHLKK